jgi:O-acetyl-ADP-ribose deacetylase (regulator of RNase III)
MEIVNKDISTVTSGIIIHGVNMRGAMNSGVARALRNRWPKVYRGFISVPKEQRKLGYVNFVHVSPQLWVLNCFTQEFYGNDGKRYASVEGITKALHTAFTFTQTQDLPLAMPKIGCGFGGLDWDTEIAPIVNELMDHYKISVTVYEI